jgi:hypothetical protein
MRFGSREQQHGKLGKDQRNITGWFDYSVVHLRVQATHLGVGAHSHKYARAPTADAAGYHVPSRLQRIRLLCELHRSANCWRRAPISRWSRLPIGAGDGGSGCGAGMRGRCTASSGLTVIQPHSILINSITAAQAECRCGAPEEIRTPNLLIRSAKFTHSGRYCQGFCLPSLLRRDTNGTRLTGVNGQCNGQTRPRSRRGMIRIRSPTPDRRAHNDAHGLDGSM